MKYLLLTALFVLHVNCLFSQTWDELKEEYTKAYRAGDFTQAYDLAEKAAAAALNESGRVSKDYATAISNLAAVQRMRGSYELAEQLYQESLELKGKLYEHTHPNYGNALNNLGNLYLDLGAYEKAEPYFKEALAIYKPTLGEKHPNYTNTLDNLGACYLHQAKYNDAETTFQASLDLKIQFYGHDHPALANTMNNLAVLYNRMGNLEKVEPLYLKAIEIKKKQVGATHPAYAALLKNLATLYDNMKEYGQAKPLYEEALAIQKNALGTDHPEYAITLNSLAVLYNNQGQFAEAAPLYAEALEIRKKAFGEHHPSVANSLNYLANLHVSLGDYVESEKYFLECYNIRKQVIDQNHPDFAFTLRNLATFYHDIGENEKAEPFYTDNARIRVNQLLNNFSYLSEKEKEKYWAVVRDDFHIFNSFAVKQFAKNPGIAGNMYNNQLATKGLLFSSSLQIRNKIINSKDSSLISDLNKWLQIKETLGRMYQMDKFTLLAKNINIKSFENLANSLEKRLSSRSDVFNEAKKEQSISWWDVRESLGENEVAIEFIDFPYFFEQHFKDIRYYVALVLRKQDEFPMLLTLCTEEQLLEPLQASNKYLDICDYVLSKTARQQLYNLVWQPIDSLIGKEKTVYVSVSGLLSKVSFACLLDEKNNMIIDKHNLHYINNTKALAMRQADRPVHQSFAAFGGIDYDLTEEQVRQKTDFYNDRDLNLSGQRMKEFSSVMLERFPFLDGTLQEADALSRIYKDAGWTISLAKGDQADEERFKEMADMGSPGILHIATHGFFYPYPDDTLMLYHDYGNFFLNSYNPLYRSGLVLAGGNYVWLGGKVLEGVEDGILSAYEVANLNLSQTELVVLSACKTGLGQIKSGEGVYGLQRSFQVAGARSVIMSLWDIPDKETIELMKLFHQKWLATGDKYRSFTNAQKDLSKKYNEPYFWAGFVMVE